MMDRLRRSVPAFPAVSIATFLLLGLICFGGRIGQAVRPPTPVDQMPVWSSQSPDDKVAPALLPVTAVLDCTDRLDPCEGAIEGSEQIAKWDDAPLLEPPIVSTEPEEQVEEEEAVAAAPSDRSPVEPKTDVATSPNETAATEMPKTVKTATASPSRFSAGPDATPWATPFEPGKRSFQLEQTARQADYFTRRGFELAGRKAYHSARAKFVQALRIIAQGLDAEHSCQAHSKALSAGLTALDEVDDFVPIGSGLEGDLDLNAIILGHETPVLKLVDRDRITPLECVRHYMEYATEQLTTANGSEVAGSMALHGLAKLHWTLADRQTADRPIDDTKAVALFQAAAEVCPENYLALNDLGVLLARAGRWTGARDVLLRSVHVSPDPKVQMNLAAVYAHLGDMPRAQQIQQQAAAMLAARGKSTSRSATPPPPVEWLSPQQFASSYAAAGPHNPEPVKHATAQPTPKEPVSQASRGFSWDWFLKTRK